MKTYSFPSVYESTLRDFATNNDPILGFSKLKYDGSDYLVGLQALNEGISPHKIINPSPDELDYKVISQSALLLASNSLQTDVKNGKTPKLIITSGFPNATFQFNKDEAIKYFKNDKLITYFKVDEDGTQNYEQRVVSIKNVNIIPELVGCDTAVRNGESPIDGSFILISLGYGTCEGVLSTPNGLSARTLFSTHGISYPVNLFTQELSKHTYLQMRTEHQIDHLFSKGFMFVNRKKKDFTNEKKIALEMYYNNVVSPTIRRYISDQDFESCNKIVIAGGGALHKDIIDLFNQEFGEILTVHIYENPDKCAANGYALYSKTNYNLNMKENLYSTDDPDDLVFLGMDLGNASTSVSIIKN
ncbi:MAG: hypothetical protein PHR40_05645 [Bacteroidales bacterium]|nr:hypothetical protein [Bacteroidales bacterium]